ncbi:hypothetical protein C8J57DRAFT_1503553 [Mycena rebaudengoi]|nr:hypothetical protein C8J57DRAFT_1503553 [Mycena rebaudengoi]
MSVKFALTCSIRRLQNVASGTFLDLPSQGDGTRVHTWSHVTTNLNQMWNLVRVSRSANEVHSSLMKDPHVDTGAYKNYLVDGIYINVPKNLRDQIWTGSGLREAKWRDSIFDCDDFAFVAKAAVANYAKDNVKATRISLLFGITYASNDKGGHAYNFYLDDSLDKITWFEPQTGKEMVDPGYKSHFGTY